MCWYSGVRTKVSDYIYHANGDGGNNTRWAWTIYHVIKTPCHHKQQRYQVPDTQKLHAVSSCRAKTTPTKESSQQAKKKQYANVARGSAVVKTFKETCGAFLRSTWYVLRARRHGWKVLCLIWTTHTLDKHTCTQGHTPLLNVFTTALTHTLPVYRLPRSRNIQAIVPSRLDRDRNTSNTKDWKISVAKSPFSAQAATAR